MSIDNKYKYSSKTISPPQRRCFFCYCLARRFESLRLQFVSRWDCLLAAHNHLRFPFDRLRCDLSAFESKTKTLRTDSRKHFKPPNKTIFTTIKQQANKKHRHIVNIEKIVSWQSKENELPPKQRIGFLANHSNATVPKIMSKALPCCKKAVVRYKQKIKL